MSGNMRTPESIWIEDALTNATPFVIQDHEKTLADILVEKAFEISEDNPGKLGLALAAAFDFLVGAEYYKYVNNNGWGYCPEGQPNLFYQYTNTCPVCILKGNFHYHPANKPPSGQIGKATTQLLCIFLHRLFERSDKQLTIYRGREPIDLIIRDESKDIALIAEIKAAPLFTLPLIVNCEKMTENTEDGITDLPHTPTENSFLSSNNLKILLPIFSETEWSYEEIDIGRKPSGEEPNWVYERLEAALVADTLIFKKYFKTWVKAFDSYKLERARGAEIDNIFWYTNACGQPSPRPTHWPTRRSVTGGYESVSDGKTSVGMDRTDDIKKGIYQVLKLGAESKPQVSAYTIKTALISNIHAVRHYNEYLTSLQDIVWTVDTTGSAKKVGDLPDEKPLYNLFDGIISFTKNVHRDEWISETFKF